MALLFDFVDINLVTLKKPLSKDEFWRSMMIYKLDKEVILTSLCLVIV